MKEEKKNDDKSRYKYGVKLEREAKKETEGRPTCRVCGMFGHNTKEGAKRSAKACFSNENNKQHELFKKGHLLQCIVGAGEDFVAEQRKKKRRKNARFEVPEDLWRLVSKSDELQCRGADCLERVTGHNSTLSLKTPSESEPD